MLYYCDPVMGDNGRWHWALRRGDVGRAGRCGAGGSRRHTAGAGSMRGGSGRAAGEVGEVGEEVGEAVGRGGRRAGEGAAGEGATLPGSLYVPKELVDIYRDEVLPLASVLTPNQFEAEQLTQRPIRSEADAVAACEALHARGPRTVFLTSIDLPAGGAAGEAAGGAGPQRVMMLASTRDDDGVLKQWRLRLPRLDQVPRARARTRASVSARARARVRAGGGGEGAGAGRGMQGHAHAMDGCATLADPRGPSVYVCPRTSPGRATWWLRCCSRGPTGCPARSTYRSCSRRRGRPCRPCCSARTPAAAGSSASCRRGLKSDAAPRGAVGQRSRWPGPAPGRRGLKLARFRRGEAAFRSLHAAQPRAPSTRPGAVPSRAARAASPREGGGAAVTHAAPSRAAAWQRRPGSNAPPWSCDWRLREG